MLALALIWSAYFIVHSWLASQRAKSWAQHHFPHWFRFYRLVYNGIALASLAVVLWFQLRLPGRQLWQHALADGIGVVLMVVGVLLLRMAFRPYDTAEFLGTRQLRERSTRVPLNTNGLNRYVRHPLYFATLVLVTGYALWAGTDKSLVLLATVLVYLVIGARLEERKLIAEYGDAYREYRQRVRMLIPFIL